MTMSDSAPRHYRYDAPGLHAIRTSAFGLEFLFAPATTAAPFETVADGAAAVVRISGPLTYAGMLFDSYDAIRSRVAAALASSASTVVLRISSPGGDVAGAFDCARGLRASARAAGKRLIAFTDSDMCSSAYAIGSAADLVVASATAIVGSVGVIAAKRDESAADLAAGIRYAIIATGERKADGNAHKPTTDAELAAMQRTVDATGEIFFALVRDHRPQLSAETLQTLQAGVVLGAQAVALGLIDQVATWDALLASLSSARSGVTLGAGLMPDDDKNKDAPKVDATRAAIEKDCASDDPDKAARAKRALAAYDGPADDDKDKDKDKDKASAAPSGASAAAPAALAAALAATNAQLAAVTSELRAVSAERERLAKADADAKAAAERATVYASRPDLAAETVKILDGMPLDQVKALLPTLPQGTPRAAANPFAPPHIVPTRGTPDLANATIDQRLAARPNPALDEAMGLTQPRYGVVREGTILHLGARLPAASKGV